MRVEVGASLSDMKIAKRRHYNAPLVGPLSIT